MRRERLRSSPGVVHEAEILGLLRNPFATQGRSYTIKSDLPETIESPTVIRAKHQYRGWARSLWELAPACDEASAGPSPDQLPSLS